MDIRGERLRSICIDYTWPSVAPSVALVRPIGGDFGVADKPCSCHEHPGPGPGKRQGVLQEYSGWEGQQIQILGKVDEIS